MLSVLGLKPLPRGSFTACLYGAVCSAVNQKCSRLSIVLSRDADQWDAIDQKLRQEAANASGPVSYGYE